MRSALRPTDGGEYDLVLQENGMDCFLLACKRAEDSHLLKEQWLSGVDSDSFWHTLSSYHATVFSFNMCGFISELTALRDSFATLPKPAAPR